MKKKLLSLLLAVCMLVPLLAVPVSAASVVTFSDVTDRDTAVAAEALRLLGVLDGYSNNTFRPEGALTRAQFCKMAVYAMNGSGELGRYRTVTVFPDVKPGHWAAPYINMAAKGKNIIGGYPDGKFHPDRVVTVGQAVTILMRLLGYKDEDVGGVWPMGHMASASTIGLTDGVGTDPAATLTRGAAARLFLNLLRADKKEGGKYSASIAASVVSNTMLVSSSAVSNNGGNTALQISTGAIYQIAGDKASNGMLNGFRGTLLLDKQGKVLTFVPDSVGSSKVVTVSAATATQLTDTAGVKYPMQGDVSSYRNGKETTWSEVYSWLTPGVSVTLYIGASGGVEYVFVGGGSAASAAVIVYTDHSSAGFDSLTNGTTGYTIYKNGLDAGVGDLRRYDVATYSAATNTIRVCDTRISGYYENAYPTPSAPEKITVLGHQFNVLPSAADTLSKLKVGSQITILLTEDNQVAGAFAADSGVAGNAIGIAKTVSTSSATVDLLCGITVTGEIIASASNASQMSGQLVRVSSGKAGALSISRLTGGVSGELNISSRKLGSRTLANNVVIFEKGPDGLVAVSLSSLTTGIIPENQITYAATDWAGRVNLIVLGTTTGSTVYYGRAVVRVGEDSRVQIKDANGKNPGETGYIPTYQTVSGQTTLTVEYGSGKKVGPFATGYQVRDGAYIAATLNGTADGYSGVTELTKLDSVPNSAWSGESAVTVAGRTYTIPATVVCYNKASASWITLSAAHAFAQSSNLYIDSSGIIRVIEVGQ